MTHRRVIVDTDVGADDALALMLGEIVHLLTTSRHFF
jgi:inosine-uridine nucleoside N-ribohydrolase